MFFRNLTLFRFSADSVPSLDNFDQALDEHRLRPCGPLELTTRGFVPPVPGDDRLTHRLTLSQNHVVLFCVGTETKILPASVVNREVAAKVKQVAGAEQRPVGGRERKRIKADVLDQLLPRAFARPGRLYGYIDPANGWLVLDTASRSAAETALSSLRDALGSFPAVPMAPQKSVRQTLTAWLGRPESHPAVLVLGDECELSNPVAGTGKWRGTHDDLISEAVFEHLRSGMIVSRLGLAFDDRIGFVLDESLTFRKLRFFDVVTDQLDDNAGKQNVGDEYAARFALMYLELARLLKQLEAWFELPRPA